MQVLSSYLKDLSVKLKVFVLTFHLRLGVVVWTNSRKLISILLLSTLLYILAQTFSYSRCEKRQTGPYGFRSSYHISSLPPFSSKPPGTVAERCSSMYPVCGFTIFTFNGAEIFWINLAEQ